VAEPLAGYPPLAMDADAGAGLAFVHAADAGPAGTAALLVGGGIELDVDVAQPTALVSLTLDLPAGGAGALDRDTKLRLDALLGARRADLLLDRARSVPGNDVSVPHVPVPDAPVQDAAHRRDHCLAPAVHRAALAYTAAGEIGTPPIVRAIGRLEAALELAKASSIPGLRLVAQRDARLAIDLLLELTPEPGLIVPEHAVQPVSDLVRAAIALDGRRHTRAPLRARADEIAHGHFTPAVPPRSPSPAILPAGAAAGPGPGVDVVRRPAGPRVDVRALPGALGDAGPVAYRRGTAEVEVRLPDWEGRHHDLWARAFHASDDVLLAVAQFRRDGPDVRARLVVPPNHAPRLEVDVTDRPELPRPSATLRAVQRATYLGRLAARAERLGRPEEATRHWRECAREWMRAGDRSRAYRAARHGREPSSAPWPPDRVIAPLVTDLLAAGPS
jgi:hypothetical protein